jgi:heme exporter protein A
MNLTATSLKKTYDRRTIFADVSLSLQTSQSLAITGQNGSGKSTLVKVLAGLASPTAGNVRYETNGKALERDDWFRKIGFVSPYLKLYDELSGIENVIFSLKGKGLAADEKKLQDDFAFFGLEKAATMPFKTYSSGMQQRVKFIQAVASRPDVLFLDEPTATLDKSGTEKLWRFVEQIRKGLILIIATNDEADLAFAERQIAMSSFKPAAQR